MDGHITSGKCLISYTEQEKNCNDWSWMKFTQLLLPSCYSRMTESGVVGGKFSDQSDGFLVGTKK